jgi:hypothetical protein
VVFEKQNSAPGDFVRLAMEGGRGGYSSYGAFELALQKTLGCDLDYVRRLLNGTRQLRENHRRTICELLGLNQIDFGVSLREFAVQLGLPRQKATALSAKGSGGIDFASRTADRYSVQQLFELIRGYWETYQWSVSKLGEQSVSRELCIVEEPDANNFIQCRLIDVNFSYAGVIFPMLQHIYFMMEKERLFDEVSFYITNRPDRTPPVLRGIALCLSGGVDEIHSYPSAGKVSFRYLGRDPDDVRKFYREAPKAHGPLEKYLTETVARYITRREIEALAKDDPVRLQIARIDNEISSTAIPFALRVTD